MLRRRIMLSDRFDVKNLPCIKRFNEVREWLKENGKVERDVTYYVANRISGAIVVEFEELPGAMAKKFVERFKINTGSLSWW